MVDVLVMVFGVEELFFLLFYFELFFFGGMLDFFGCKGLDSFDEIIFRI